MGGFRAAFINEVEKMYKKKKAVVAVIISLLVIIIGQLIITGVRNQLGLRGVSSTEFPILVLSVFVNTILPLFVALVAIDIFSGEFSHNTMKIALTRPVTRLKLFTAKIAAIAFFALANLLIVMILSTITGFIFNSASVTASALGRIFISYIVTLIPVITLAIIIVFLANIFRSGVAVFFVSIIVFIVFKVLGVVFSQYSNLLITSMLTWYNLWLADSLPIFKILRQLLIMAGYDIMFFVTAYYLFDKKDL